MMSAQDIAALEVIETAFFTGELTREKAMAELQHRLGFSEREAAAILYLVERIDG